MITLSVRMRTIPTCLRSDGVSRRLIVFTENFFTSMFKARLIRDHRPAASLLGTPSQTVNPESSRPQSHDDGSRKWPKGEAAIVDRIGWTVRIDVDPDSGVSAMGKVKFAVESPGVSPQRNPVASIRSPSGFIFVVGNRGFSPNPAARNSFDRGQRRRHCRLAPCSPVTVDRRNDQTAEKKHPEAEHGSKDNELDDRFR